MYEQRVKTAAVVGMESIPSFGAGNAKMIYNVAMNPILPIYILAVERVRRKKTAKVFNNFICIIYLLKCLSTHDFVIK